MKRKPRVFNPLLRGPTLPPLRLTISDQRTIRKITVQMRFARFSIRADNQRGYFWWGREVNRSTWSTAYAKKRSNLARWRAAWRTA